MTWNPRSEWTTDIPVTDLENPQGLKHFVRNLKAVSITDTDMFEARMAVLTFEVIRGCIGPTIKKAEIIGKIKSLSKVQSGLYVHVSASSFGANFKVWFNLRQAFCDEVIDFVQDFFTTFGISDPRKFRLADFTAESVTMYRQGEGWISFTDYLKLKHGLPASEMNVEMMPDTRPLY